MVLWLAACAWITEDDLTSLKDQDGDGYVAKAFGGEDCDDTDVAVSPEADEVCDGVDNDCDGEVDEDEAGPRPYFKDLDGDDYGNLLSEESFCPGNEPPEFVEQPGDCDDGDDAVNPDADEVCDGVDNDCDGEVDVDAIDASTWYGDKDEDGYGADGSEQVQCDSPQGKWVEDVAGDCDDEDPTTYPDADELCDGLDNDCDDEVDEDPVDEVRYYADDDGDGYGDSWTSTLSCEAPTGYVEDDTDCDDTDGSTYPGAPELCDDVDNDCDSTTDYDIYVPSDVGTITAARV